MVKVVTIHGTNAGADSDSGDQWWQKGSPFQQRLQQYIADPLEFEPFHWSGANSEIQRRKTGKLLAARLRALDEPPIVIGHSHGGSVLAHALFTLFRASKKAWPEFLRAAATIGTPMFRYRATWNWLARYNILAQPFLIIGGMFVVGLFTVAVSLLVGIFSLATDIETAGVPDTALQHLWRFLAVVVSAVGIALLLYLGPISIFGRTRAARNRAFAANALAKPKTLRFNHSKDEAVTGLRSALNAKFSIIGNKTIRRAARPWIMLLLLLNYLPFFAPNPNIHESWIDYNPLIEQGGGANQNEYPIVGLKKAEALGYYYHLSEETTELYWQRRLANLSKGQFQSIIPLKDSFYVIDFAEAMSKRTPEELAQYIERADKTERMQFLCWEVSESGLGCRMRAIAIYLTPFAMHRLASEARALTNETQIVVVAPQSQNSETVDIRWNFSPYDEAAVRSVEGSFADNYPQPFRDLTVPVFSADSPFDRLLQSGALIRVAGKALVSESTLPAPGYDPDLPAYYPPLNAGDVVVMEYLNSTIASLRCLVSDFDDKLDISDWSPALGEFLDQTFGFDGACGLFETPSFGPERLILLIQTLPLGFLPGWFNDTWFQSMDLVRKNISEIGDFVADGGSLDAADWGTVGQNIFTAAAWTLIMFTIMIAPMTLLLTFLFTWLLAAVATPIFRGIFSSQIKNSAFGNDGFGEKVVQVASGVNFSDQSIGTLPGDVEDAIERYTQSYASDALQKVRNIVSLAADGNRTPLLSEVAASLTWKELIHTAYFDVDEFVRHLAENLADGAGLTFIPNPPPPPPSFGLRSSAVFRA